METGQRRHAHEPAPVDVDAIDLLMDDHRLVREYFAHIDAAAHASIAADRHRKPDLIQQVCDEIETHSRIEREIFYPAVRAAFKESDDPLVDHAEHDHAEIDGLIAQLRGLDAKDESRADELLVQLRKAVEAHVHEEEEAMFTKARSQIDGMAIGRQLVQQKRAIAEEKGQVC
jgi:iron-sulfur cluster repair protein YtfE (RIC family)